MSMLTGFKAFGKGVVVFARRNSPTILTGISIVGLAGTAYLSGKATLKAAEIVNYHTFLKEEEAGHAVKLSKMEVLKLTWKCYVPTAVTIISTSAAIIGSNSISIKRTAAAASALSLTETAFKEYKSKVVETIGEKKDRAIDDAVAQEKIDANPVSKNTIVQTGAGDQLFYEVISGRYFNHDIERIRKIQNDINQSVINGRDNISVNDVYYRLGLATTALMDEIGWNTSNMLEFRFTTKLADNGRACVVLGYEHLPLNSFRY